MLLVFQFVLKNYKLSEEMFDIHKKDVSEYKLGRYILYRNKRGS